MELAKVSAKVKAVHKTVDKLNGHVMASQMAGRTTAGQPMGTKLHQTSLQTGRLIVRQKTSLLQISICPRPRVIRRCRRRLCFRPSPFIEAVIAVVKL